MATVYKAKNGLVSFEIESAPAPNVGRAERDEAGYSGSSFCTWNCGMNPTQPGRGKLSYEFEVDESGTYFVTVCSRRDLDGRDKAFDQENDFLICVNDGGWERARFGQGDRRVLTDEHRKSRDNYPALAYGPGAGAPAPEISGRANGAEIDMLNIEPGSQNTSVDQPSDGSDSPSPPPVSFSPLARPLGAQTRPARSHSVNESAAGMHSARLRCSSLVVERVRNEA